MLPIHQIIILWHHLLIVLEDSIFIVIQLWFKRGLYIVEFGASGMKVVVVGLGYVGLTLALTLADVGFKVEGVDKDKKKIDALRNEIPTLYESNINQILTSNLSAGKISFSENISKSDKNVTYIISVGTPINEQTSEPLLENLKKSVLEVAKNLKKEDLVILRSTVPVGTTRTLILKILEDESNLKVSRDFYLASAPERTLQGHALQELRQLPQIIGGIDEASVEKTSSIFNKITETVVKVSSLEAAELIKLFDNSYRDITISIGNLYGKICKKLNLDAKEVIQAANYGYSRNKILFPGAGVGGGCLVKDPYLLIASINQSVNLDLIKISRQINDSMITDTIELIEDSFRKTRKNISGSKILVLGFAFKGFPQTDDIRFSPTVHVIEHLLKSNAKLYGHDPVVPEKSISELGIKFIHKIYDEVDYDVILIMNNNPEYKNLDFKRLKHNESLLVIDGWYLYDKQTLRGMGVDYFALGSKN